MGDEHFQIKLFWGYIWSEVEREVNEFSMKNNLTYCSPQITIVRNSNDDPQIMVCVTYMIQNDEPVKE